MANPLDFLKSFLGKKSDPGSAATAVEPAEPAAAGPAPLPEIEEIEVPSVPSVGGVAAAADSPDGTAAPLDPDSPAGIYEGALKAVAKFFNAATKLKNDVPGALPMQAVHEAATKIVALMEQEGDDIVALAVAPYPDVDRFIIRHSVNVAVLSQRVARQLGLTGEELETLAVAALVHDVGTVRIPKDTFYKVDTLTSEEWALMRERPAHSRDIILTLGAGYRAVAEIAHQVHERLDGNGYPRGLEIDDIALEASILGAVDIFEAFVHPRPYKNTVPAAAMYGVDNLMRMSHQFGDGVLKALVRSVGLFPVGTYVRLNSGEVARVQSPRAGNPMRPVVEVIFDAKKSRLAEPRRVNLMKTPHLYVFKPLSPEDLAEIGIL